MGIQPGARFPALSADALPATLYGHFTQVIYRNRPITPLRLVAGERGHERRGGGRWHRHHAGAHLREGLGSGLN
jgi:hypothetical protein